MFDMLKLLDTSETRWKVRVRVIRLWMSIGNDGAMIQGCNLILLDEENYPIQAFIKPDLWINLANVIIEGNIYDVSHFFTKRSTGRLRPVHSDMCISFTTSTIVQHVLEDDLTIPFHKFEISNLGDLSNILASYEEDRSPAYSIDVIGVVRDLQPPSMINTIYGERRFVRFVITDGRFSYKVNVWGDNGVNENALFEHDLQIPVVVCIASVRLCKFKGVCEISTLSSSKIYVNLQNDDVSLFRERYEEQGFLNE